jgi:hypothetical protein
MRAILFGSCLMALAGCGASLEQLHSRAAFDLNCPLDQIQVVVIDNRTRGVRGCGRQVTYVESCTDPARAANTCTWVMNTDSGSSTPPAAPSPPPAAPPPVPK